MLTSSRVLNLCVAMCAVALGGCDFPWSPDWDESVATIDESMLAQNQAIEIDTIVAAGTSGRVSIVTGGSGSCTRFGRTAIDWQGPRTVVITPYNENLKTADVCTADFHFFHHRVTIRYPEPGIYSVRVRAMLLRANRIDQVADRAVRVQ